MITVHLYYTGEKGSARAFAEEMTRSGIVSAIRAEDGNQGYEYFFPMDDPETVLLIDRWRDQAAIDAHHAFPMMERIASLHHSIQIRTISSRLEMGSDFALSSGNFLPPTGSQESGKQDGKEDLL